MAGGYHLRQCGDLQESMNHTLRVADVGTDPTEQRFWGQNIGVTSSMKHYLMGSSELGSNTAFDLSFVFFELLR